MEYIVEAEDTDITKWTVGVSAGTLKEQGQPALAASLCSWSEETGNPPCIVFEIRFPDDFPFTVPFVRVVRPRFQFHTGHVTIGGSLCTEMLTPSGWRSMTVDALLRSIMETLRDGGARIQLTPDVHCRVPLRDYSPEEARAAFERVANEHGWLKRGGWR